MILRFCNWYWVVIYTEYFAHSMNFFFHSYCFCCCCFSICILSLQYAFKLSIDKLNFEQFEILFMYFNHRIDEDSHTWIKHTNLWVLLLLLFPHSSDRFFRNNASIRFRFSILAYASFIIFSLLFSLLFSPLQFKYLFI